VYSLAVSGTNLFAGTDYYGVYRSTNNGTSWIQADSGLTYMDVHCLAPSGMNLFAGPFQGGVFLSTNNGTSWIAYDTGLPQSISVASFAFSASNVFAATGYGIWRRPLSEFVSVQRASSVLPNRFDLAQNYPNPFNPLTIIRFAIPTRSRVHLSVFNTLGQRVAQLVNEEMNAGNFEKTWNANVASGLYLYRLEAVSVTDPGKRFVDVKKMILLK
jgi:hypothetical protein